MKTTEYTCKRVPCKKTGGGLTTRSPAAILASSADVVLRVSEVTNIRSINDCDDDIVFLFLLASTDSVTMDSAPGVCQRVEFVGRCE